jgi:hypothetical protein
VTLDRDYKDRVDPDIFRYREAHAARTTRPAPYLSARWGLTVTGVPGCRTCQRTVPSFAPFYVCMCVGPLLCFSAHHKDGPSVECSAIISNDAFDGGTNLEKGRCRPGGQLLSMAQYGAAVPRGYSDHPML